MNTLLLDETDQSLTGKIGDATVTAYLLDQTGAELGVFYFLSMACVGLLLNQVDGKISRLRQFLMNRNFQLLKHDGLITFINFILKMLCYCFLVMPPISLGVWGGALIKKGLDTETSIIGGISVLLVGLSFLCFLYTTLKIKWDNYRFTSKNMIFLFLCYAFLTAYQFIATLQDRRAGAFFGYTAIFLSANCVLVIIIVFLNSGIQGSSMRDFLAQKLNHGQARDSKRDKDFDDEINEERQNMEYFPTYEDVTDLFTIASVSEKKMISAFGGGLQKIFAHLPKNRKRFVSLLLWAISLAVIIVYGFVIYWVMDQSTLGFVIMFAVFTTDIYLYLLYNARIVESSTLLCITAIISRFFLFIFGGKFWIYGYMINYIFYGAILTIAIGTKRFPFEGAYAEINLDNVSKRQHKIDLSQIPEFVLAIITGVFVAIFIILVATTPETIPLESLKIGQTYFDFYMVGIFSVLIVATFLCIYSTYRLFKRKMKEIHSTYSYFIKSSQFDRYWMFIVLTFIFVIVYSLIAYWAADNISFLIIGGFGSLTIILYLNSYLHFAMNDYKVLQDVNSLNTKIVKHNKHLEELKIKVGKIKTDLLEGKTGAIGENQLGLAQNIMKSNKQTKVKQRTIKLAKQKTQAVYQGQDPSASEKQLSPVNQSSKKLLDVKKQFKSEQPAAKKFTLQDMPVSVAVPRNHMETADVSIIPKTSLVQNETDRMIEEEMKKNMNNVEDEMYEGGEGESRLSQMNQEEVDDAQNQQRIGSDESSDDELDPNEEQDLTRQQTKRIKEFVDWRLTMNPISAYFRGHLRHNDYNIINSMCLALISLAIMAFLVCLNEQTLIGVTIAVPFLHYGMAFFSLIRHLSTDSKLSIVETTFFFLSYAIQYGWGIAYLFIAYDPHQMNASAPGSAAAGQYIVVYLIVLPFITSSSSAVAKWLDDKGNFSLMFIVQIGITLIQGIGMLVCAFVFLTYIQGVIISVIIGFISYLLLQTWIYVKNDCYLPPVWQIINLTLVSLIVISGLIVSFFFDEFLTFEGFSISIWVLCFFMFLYSFAEIFSDIRKIEERPIFFSPWIFPVYIYNPKKNDVERHNLPALAMIVAFIVMIAWSILASVWVQPYYIGVSLSILFELILIVCVLYLVSVSQLHFKSVQPYVDDFLVRLAWLDTKQGYINGRAAPNREQLVTYQTMLERRDNFRNYIRIKEGRKTLTYLEQQEDVQLKEKDQIDLEWVDETLVNLGSINSCYSYLFTVEKKLNATYIEELELILQFQLLIVQQAENLQQAERKYLFKFINEKKAALFALGIVINIPEQGSMSVRYARVITQIQKLSPEKQTMFNSLRDHFINEQRALELEMIQRAKIEEEKEKDRQEMMAQMSMEKRKLLESVSEDMDVDAMPDCEIKYKKILKESKAGKIFEDKNFGHDDNSLGPNCLNRGVASWVRARDMPECVLYHESISHLDVVQGALGDCYFLSAISVLGEKYVKDIIITIENQEEWRECGAFCVKFYKNGYSEIIIIDDYFPAYAGAGWAFVRGGQEGNELWPMVLEKAYAKMYGSYNYIEAGKVQYALADMTDGFPEQIDLRTNGKNIQLLWEQIKTLQKHGALMGAGSPENALGDSAINEMGIVQGHAYAVLNIVEVDGFRLMQLRNPHGSRGVEWKGDWADDSEKWTDRFRNKVGYLNAGEDGVFWMDVLDFVEQYSYLYICRILGEGWKEIREPGEWKGSTAEGLPTRTNPNARLDFNPQYEVLVTRPCEGFIMLEQQDQINMFKGKHSIFFMVSKCNGELITTVDKNTLVCRSGAPCNLNIMTSECDFDKSVSYPYKYTLMVANAEHGEDGEGKFDLYVYATDPNVTVTKLPPPKDMP